MNNEHASELICIIHINNTPTMRECNELSQMRNHTTRMYTYVCAYGGKGHQGLLARITYML